MDVPLSCPSSKAFKLRSGLLPIVDIDAAVFLLASVYDLVGKGGDATSFDAALPSHANGFVGFRPAA